MKTMTEYDPNIDEQLIFDRTQADIINRTPLKFAGDYVMLNRIENACLFMSEQLGLHLVCKEWEPEDWRYQSEMDRIKNNINTIRESYFVDPTTPATPSSITLSSYTQANNVEKILYDLVTRRKSDVSGMHRFPFKLGMRTFGNSYRR